jgi:nickel/cobalt exporter
MSRKSTAAALFLLFAPLAAAQENPFFSGREPAAETRSPPAPGVFQAVVDGVIGLQRDLNARLAELSRSVKEEGNIGMFFILLAVAFGYGLVHALGPGHGKVVMASYALAKPLKAKQGVLLGAGVAVIHTLSAVLLVTVVFLLLQSSYQAYGGEPKKVVTLVSDGLIAGMGAFLLVKAFLRSRKPAVKSAEPTARADDPAGTIRDLFVPAVLMGLVPCEGAILILVFSLSIDAFWLGIVLSAAMSAGMAVTISAAGLAALGTKKGSLKLLAKKEKLIRTATAILQLAGAAVIILFGLLLFIGNLR